MEKNWEGTQQQKINIPAGYFITLTVEEQSATISIRKKKRSEVNDWEQYPAGLGNDIDSLIEKLKTFIKLQGEIGMIPGYQHGMLRLKVRNLHRHINEILNIWEDNDKSLNNGNKDNTTEARTA